ncbi:hypothetical protein DNTS_027548 [Danionella cerebrum]|uniref:Peroxiredoxin-like 2A n=1 Tax=Danionella cerebrum TaxID=2873325 RepID=A0A553RQL8_9TELE|nr:hypothetical protein DNTS_027548 [Danionella translucida]
MAEASDLSSLQPQLDECGVPLFAVVKENTESEIHDFRPFFSGDIFLDQKECGQMGGEHIKVVSGVISGEKDSYWGQFMSSDRGILLEHREMEFGDKVQKSDVIQALERIKTERVALK